jgi:putative exporter of polyketide antibiotics
MVPDQATPEFTQGSWLGALALIATTVVIAVGYIMYRRRLSSDRDVGEGMVKDLHSRIVSLLRR